MEIPSPVPESLVEIPALSAPVINSTGNIALVQETGYSSIKSESTNEIKAAHISNRTITEDSFTTLTANKDIKSACWAIEDTVLALRKGNQGTTELICSKCSRDFEKEAVVVGTFRGAVRNLRSAVLDRESVIITVEGSATAAGELYNAETATKPASTGKEYGAMPIRYMGAWNTPQHNSIFAAIIKKADSSDLSEQHMTKPTDVLKGTGLRLHRHGQYSVSKYGVTLVAEPFFPGRADYFSSIVVFISTSSIGTGSPDVTKYHLSNATGVATSPEVSPNGKHLVFLQKPKFWYEDEQSQVVMVQDIHDPKTAAVVPTWLDPSGSFTLTPLAIIWSSDGDSFFLTAEYEGHIYLYKMPAQASSKTVEPERWTDLDGVGSMTVMPHSEGHLVVASSRALEPQIWSKVSPKKKEARALWKADNSFLASKSGEMPGYFEFTFPGVKKSNVHAWVVTPSGFDKSKKYPLMLCIHGGPVCAWNDTWINDMGACWNFPLFAAQGYVVVAPNITGSSGFGQDFSTRVTGDIGGDTYEDVVKLMDHIEMEMPYIDTGRAVALGLSFGGYMVNWIQANPLGRKFKALVCESGIFNLYNGYTYDVSICPAIQGVKFPEERAALDRFNPAVQLGNWQTPCLFIVGEQDFRIVYTEGIAAFHYLQDKGVESRILCFPDEGHVTEQPANRVQWWNNVLGWCNKYTGNTGKGKIVMSYPNMDPELSF